MVRYFQLRRSLLPLAEKQEEPMGKLEGKVAFVTGAARGDG